MNLVTALDQVVEDTQSNFQTTLNENPEANGTVVIISYLLSPDRFPHHRVYFHIFIGVILIAIISLAMILMYFCRRNQGHPGGVQRIVTNIELQEARHNSNEDPMNQRPIFNTVRDGNVTITVIERY